MIGHSPRYLGMVGCCREPWIGCCTVHGWLLQGLMGRTKERYHSSSPPKACSLMAKTDCIQVTKQGRISNVITSLEGRYAEKNTKSKEIKNKRVFGAV